MMAQSLQASNLMNMADLEPVLKMMGVDHVLEQLGLQRPQVPALISDEEAQMVRRRADMQNRQQGAPWERRRGNMR